MATFEQNAIFSAEAEMVVWGLFGRVVFRWTCRTHIAQESGQLQGAPFHTEPWSGFGAVPALGADAAALAWEGTGVPAVGLSPAAVSRSSLVGSAG